MTTGAASTGRRGPSDRLLRWTAVLFIAGSVLFGLGAFPFYSEAVGLRVCALTFFVGSLFFTGAAFLQYREAVDTLPAGSRRHTLAVWAPRDLGWLACADTACWHALVQLEHGQRAPHQPRRGPGRSARVAAGRARLNRLSGRQRAGPS